MKILQTESERRSFLFTSILFLLMLLLFFFYKFTYIVEDVAVQGGEIAINFGTSDLGKGEEQPIKEVEMSPENQEVSESEVIQPIENKVVTQNVVETPVIKTPTEKMKVEKPVEKPIVNEERPERKPNQSTTDALASLLNGPKQTGEQQRGHGNRNVNGDQGDPNGSLYASSFYGSGSGQGGTGGVSWGLNGRSLASKGKVIPDCNEVGTVVVEIRVNKGGQVISAQHTKGTTNPAQCLIDAAIATAKTFRWKADDKAPQTQIGFIVINFRVGT